MAKRAKAYFMPEHIEEAYAVISPAGRIVKATVRDDMQTSREVAERIMGKKWKRLYKDGARCRWVGIAIIPTLEEKRLAAALAKRPAVKKGAKKK